MKVEKHDVIPGHGPTTIAHGIQRDRVPVHWISRTHDIAVHKHRFPIRHDKRPIMETDSTVCECGVPRRSGGWRNPIDEISLATAEMRIRKVKLCFGVQF